MPNFNLIIPTYNRPNYLQRILDYYHQYGSDFNIIVADSSSNENKELNKKIISSFPYLKIQYLDNYPSKINPHHKFADMVNYAQEKYCVFCADDDFVTPKGIDQSIDFLENNPDFTVAHGYYISFYLKTKKKGEKQFYWKPEYSPQSIIFSDPKSRLAKHLSDHSMSTFYGVHRTDFLKMIYQELLSSKVDPLLFGELLPDMLTSIYGKMKHLDVLYAARQVCPGYSYWPSLIDFIHKGKYDGEYKKFRNCLAIHLSKKSYLDIEESKKVIDDAMSAYLKKSYPNNFKYFFKNKMKDILNWLPDGVSEKIRSLYISLTFSKPIDNSLNSINNPSSKYYEDFNRIRDCALSHIKK